MCVLSHSSCLILCDLLDCSPPGSSVHGDSPGKNTGVGCHSLLQGIHPGTKPRSQALQADSLLCEPPGKSKFHVYHIIPFLYTPQHARHQIFLVSLCHHKINCLFTFWPYILFQCGLMNSYFIQWIIICCYHYLFVCPNCPRFCR